MFRKSFSMFSLVIIFTLLASLSGAAYAKEAPPDGPVAPIFPPGYHPPVPESLAGQSYAAANRNASPAPGQGDGKVRAQAAVLGKPGSVFAYQSTSGSTGVPYLPDTTHTYIYTPNGLTFDSSNNLYVVEELGAQLMKFNSSGAWQWTTGQPGIHDWGATGLNFPEEVAVAPDGSSVWVADNDIASQFAVNDGHLLQHFPPAPWAPPDDNYRFYELRGVAFDSQGHLYLSDRGRGRIQAFELDGSGNPNYSTTIDPFKAPAQIAFDASDNLYVADVDDFTVKKCIPNKAGGWPWGWSCSIFFGVSGHPGDDPSHLGYAYGLGMDAVHNVLFIGDGLNHRVIRCTTAGSCNPLITSGFKWPADIAVRPSNSNLYVSDWNWNSIRQFVGEAGPGTGNPVAPDPFLGGPNHLPYQTNNPPYTPSNPILFNGPSGIEADAAGNVYIVEDAGNRLTKLDSHGNVLWSHGHAGISNWSNDSEDPAYMDWPKAVTVDRRNIVIVGGGGSLIRTYNGANGGAYMDTLSQFNDVWGVATDSSNYIYISDQGANQVKVYSYTPTSKTSKFKYIRTVGAGGACGSSNSQLCSPRGIAVDTAKNLYVADHNNCRVQKFDSRGNYKQTFGSGVCGDSFSRLGGPSDVAVDALGRVYVAEEWNNRVMVFDKTGAYLASLFGRSDVTARSFSSPRSIALDKQGNLYVTDWEYSRVQKFATSVPYWTQININGFGYRQNSDISALGTFKNVLYAGGVNQNNQATIWKRLGTTWVPVMDDSFEDSNNGGIEHLLEYKGYLYASTYNSNGGQIWRSPDGMTWQMSAVNGFHNDRANGEILRLVVIGGQLCATTWSDPAAHGGQIWCSTSGESGTWQEKVEDGFGSSDNFVIMSLIEYSNTGLPGGNAVYASTGNETNGAGIWRRAGSGALSNQDIWVKVTGPTWTSDSGYIFASGLTVYKGYLYTVLRHNHIGDPLVDKGASIYRCHTCDGSDWAEVAPNGLSNPNSFRGYALEATTNGLYAVVGNMVDGLDIWWSKDGAKDSWTRPFAYGLGNNNNVMTDWDNATLWWGGRLYTGIYNYTDGAGVWKLCPTTKVCR